MVYDKKDIILGNLSHIGKKQTELLEKQFAHLGELATLLCEEAGEEEIFFRDPGFLLSYTELMKNLHTVTPEVSASVNTEKISALETPLSAFSRAFICRRLSDNLGIKGIQATGTYFEDFGTDGNETISYMQNSYADEAYSRFASTMTEPKVMYGHDFSEICENVYYERSAYCILPIENSSDGRLAGFRRLILKYGLKTVMITKVKTAQEGETTVFALLKKNIVVPICEGNKFFEFRIKTADALSTLINAADACMMKPVSISSVPDQAFVYDVVFSVNEEGICGFLSFMFLEYREFMVTGFFGEL